ncbi:MAG TPA: WecB/TagA/CpsF family glycosyltransferase, partial [Limnochordia bacterium]
MPSGSSAPMAPPAPEKRPIVLGCPVDALTLAETVAWVDGHLAGPEPTPVQHVALNAAKVVAMQRNPALREAILRCGLISADGQSIVWAARWLGARLPERVAGIDLMEELVGLAARRGYRVYFLGARPAVVEAVVRHYRARYPRLAV